MKEDLFDRYNDMASEFLEHLSEIVTASAEDAALLNGRFFSLKLLRQPSRALTLRVVLPCCFSAPSGELPTRDQCKFFFLVVDFQDLFLSYGEYCAYLLSLDERGAVALTKKQRKELRDGEPLDPPYALLAILRNMDAPMQKAVVTLQGNTLDCIYCRDGKPNVSKTRLKQLAFYLYQSCFYLLYRPDSMGHALEPLYMPMGWCALKSSPYYPAADPRFHPVGKAPDFLKTSQRQFIPVDTASPWLPLMAYTAFSLLKPFIKAYPGRMSAKMSYQKAVRALENSFSIALSGPFALETAQKICGIFAEYGGCFFPEDGRKRSLSPGAKAIHDGVCIFTNVQKWTAMTWQNHRLHDYCMLAVGDAELPQPNVLCLYFPADTGIPDEGFCANWKSLMVQFLEYILKRWTSGRLKENSPDYTEAKQKIKRWEELQKRHPERVLTRPKPLAPLPPLVDVDAAYRDLQQTNADRMRRKWCAYLLASWRVLLDFQYGHDAACVETAYRQAQRYFLALSRKDTAGRKQPDLITIFSQYLSDSFERGWIRPLRQEPVKDGCCRGWYERRKNLIYLPYASYFSDFSGFCAQRGVQMPSRSAFHQEVLAPCGIIQGFPNRKNAPYLQFARQVVVSSAEKRERVLPVQLAALSSAAPLSGQARDVLRQFRQM